MMRAIPRQVTSAPPALLIGFVLLVAMVVTSLALASRLAHDTSQVTRQLDYGRALNVLLAALRDAEIGQRGYLLTGDRRYLEPYSKSISAIPKALNDMETADAARGKAVKQRVQPIITAKLREMTETIARFNAGNRSGAIALVRTDVGMTLMERLRVELEAERKRSRMQGRTITGNAARIVTFLTIGLSAGLMAIVALAIGWLRQTRTQIDAVERARSSAESALAALQAENVARQAAEEKVRHMQKMESLGQLTGGIAHDFNNMLAVVMGGIELAKRRLTGNPDKSVQHLDNAFEGAQRAAALTARLLAFARNQPLAPVAIDANKLVGGMSDLLTRTLGDAISIETVFAAGLWRSYADPGEVENALLNLAVNARDAMPEGGKLTIETANAHIDDNYARERADVVPGQYVLICVTDTGIGMTSEVLARVFDPFFTTKSVGKGTGLGLSQVFGFTKQSGGHVAVYSEVGQGTTVKLYLPRFVGETSDAPNQTDSRSASAPSGATGEVILVVEDEPRVRHFAMDALRELGYSAIPAASPVEALRLLEKLPEITLLFTDIVMPDMTGRQLAERAKTMRPDLRILYTTGYTRNAVVHNGLLDIGVAFLPKPYTILDLARKMREVIDGGGINRTV